MIPIHGARPAARQRYRRRPGVYAILSRGGKVLLTHQSDPIPELQLPGGGLDPGEAPLRALHREVLEETGWTIGAARLLGRYRQFGYIPEYSLWAEKMCSIYIARPISRVSVPLHSEHTAVWMPPRKAVDQLTNAGDRTFVQEMISKLV